MSNPNTVHLVVELGPESQAKLDKILEALQGRTGDTIINLATGQKATKGPESIEPDEDAPPFDAEEDKAPEYTKSDIQTLTQRLAAPDSPKRAKARAIIKKYAPKISAIPAEQYAAVMAELLALDAE